MRHLYKQALLGAVLCVAASGASFAQTTVAGTTPGQFSVNESGAATYSIPIQVPPGVAGMQPKLSLEYNSQGGNGLLGMGWSLSGLSAISRCPRTMAHDSVRGAVNYDMNDRFCLDGQRLILVGGSYGVSGSEYRTERESYSNIQAFGAIGAGPQHFVVKSKAGVTMEYGNAVDARVLSQPGTVVRTWALSKITDARANIITVSYFKSTDNSVQVPAVISYGGNATTGTPNNQSVSFEYDASRVDKSQGYLSGSLVQMDRRISNVRTYTGSTLVGDYRTTYQHGLATSRSRLTGLQQCDATDNCLPAITFGWQDGGALGWLGSDGPMPANWNPNYVQAGDFNGDGKTDLFSLQDADSSFGAKRYVMFTSSDNGGFTASDGPMPANWNPNYVWMGDFNGDGNTDLLSLQEADSGFGSRRYVMFISNGNGGFTASDGSMPTNWNPNYVWMADFNGDGKADIFSLQDADGSFGARRYVMFLSNGSGGFTAVDNSTSIGWNPSYVWTGDFNGDGKTDLLSMQDANSGFGAKRYMMFLSNDAGGFSIFDNPMSANWNPNYVWAGDFNGDGRTDLLSLQDSDGSFGTRRYVMFISSGNGGFTPIDNPMPANWNPSYVRVGDFNGDGNSDLFSLQDANSALGTKRYVMFFSNGNGGFTASDNPMPANWNPNYVWASDIDGNGKLDLLSLQETAANFAAGRLASFKSSGLVSDLMIKAASGLSPETTITYKPITDNTIYAKQTDAAYPIMDIKAAMYVVSSMASGNGVGGVNTVEYSYGGLKAEQGTGRGSLGFRWMKSKSLANNIESYTEFNQNWPFTGTVAKNETRLAGSGNAGLLKRTVNTYAQTAGSAGATVFVYPGQSIEESWDLGGTPYPSTTTNYVYGQNPQYGDPTQITVSNSEGSSKSTANEYWPADSSNWILGRLKKATVTSVKP